jgi:hypothetical protein
LSLDDFYRREIENRVGNLVGMDISFSDCRVERYEQNLSWSAAQFEVIEREVESLRAPIRGAMTLQQCASHCF